MHIRFRFDASVARQLPLILELLFGACFAPPVENPDTTRLIRSPLRCVDCNVPATELPTRHISCTVSRGQWGLM